MLRIVRIAQFCIFVVFSTKFSNLREKFIILHWLFFLDSGAVLGITPGATLVTLEFVKLAATSEVAATTVPDTLELELSSPEIVPEFTSKLGSTHDVVEGFDTVPGALTVVPQ